MKASELIRLLNKLIDDFGDQVIKVEGVGDPVTAIDYEISNDGTHFIVNDFGKG